MELFKCAYNVRTRQILFEQGGKIFAVTDSLKNVAHDRYYLTVGMNYPAVMSISLSSKQVSNSFSYRSVVPFAWLVGRLDGWLVGWLVSLSTLCVDCFVVVRIKQGRGVIFG